MIGESAFDYCESLTRIVIPETVTKIDYSAFQYCRNLEEINIPSNMETIKNRSFQDCTALTSLKIPESITSIETLSFMDSGLKDIYYAGTEEQWNAIVNPDKDSILKRVTIHFNSK